MTRPTGEGTVRNLVQEMNLGNWEKTADVKECNEGSDNSSVRFSKIITKDGDRAGFKELRWAMSNR